MMATVVALAACFVSSETPGRYTYAVKYALTGSIVAAADVTYTDETGTGATVLAVTVPWSVEFTMDYDYDNPLFPDVRVFNSVLADGETVTLSISWKDYKVDFAEELLADRAEANSSGGPLPLDITLFSAPLPP